ncbi:MAG: hypothetical protein J07HR59_01418 [Halorubrum sp. J07HR59]|nr:MAG: hypothetical protein J07HR59_01418 [Halorubrum sp. J07HR59]
MVGETEPSPRRGLFVGVFTVALGFDTKSSRVTPNWRQNAGSVTDLT